MKAKGVIPAAVLGDGFPVRFLLSHHLLAALGLLVLGRFAVFPSVRRPFPTDEIPGKAAKEQDSDDCSADQPHLPPLFLFLAIRHHGCGCARLFVIRLRCLAHCFPPKNLA